MLKLAFAVLPWLFVSTMVGGSAMAIGRSETIAQPIPMAIAQAEPASESSTLAQQITVKVLTNTNQGSGTLLAQQGDTYLVLTNTHVLQGASSLQIQTYDGQKYIATVVPNAFPKDYDLALMSFQSSESYTLAEVADFTPRVEQNLIIAGYQAETGAFGSSSAQLQQVLSQPLQTGYQLGYNGEVVQGMSGGPILESGTGMLMGINGRSATPLLNDFTRQDGSQPSAAEIEQWRQLNWGIPIRTVLAQIQPQILTAYGLPLPQTSPVVQSKFTGPLAELERQAKQFTVKINRSKDNGSGVIIAKEGNTYTVLTANHVVCETVNGAPPCPSHRYTLTTYDGQTHTIPDSSIQRLMGVDLAVVQFTSSTSYPVAALANDNVSKADFAFVAGYPIDISTNSSPWLLSAGLLESKEQGTMEISRYALRTNDNESLGLATSGATFSNGYELVYTSITYEGMSGGPVIDRQGRVIGIHGLVEGEKTNSTSEIQFGYSLGIPIRKILAVAPQLRLHPQHLLLDATPLPVLSTNQFQQFNAELGTIAIPQGNATAKDWIERGNQLWRLSRHQEAINAFEKVIQQPSDLTYLAYTGKGLALIDQGDFEAALKALQIAVEQKPDYLPALRFKSFAYRELQQYDQALATIDVAIRQRPNDANLYNDKSSFLNRLKRYDEALKAIDQALILSSRAAFYSNRSHIYNRLKQYNKAIADCTRAITLDPKITEAYVNRGNAYNFLRQHDKAIADYTQALEINPKLAEAYVNRGNTYNLLQQYDQAIADFNKVINVNQTVAIDPKYAEVFNGRGFAYVSLQQYEQGIADFSQAIIINPENAEVHIKRGLAYSALQQYDEAIVDYTRAIAINPKYAEAFNNRGFVYNKLQQYAQAITDLNQAIAINPQFAEAYGNRGLTYIQLHDIPRAKQDLQKAADLFQAQNRLADYQKAMSLLQQL